jgi:hypothetical protein
MSFLSITVEVAGENVDSDQELRIMKIIRGVEELKK